MVKKFNRNGELNYGYEKRRDMQLAYISDEAVIEEQRIGKKNSAKT